MKTEKRLGIWMDHSSAHLMEYVEDPSGTKTIESKYSHHEKDNNLGKSEFMMHDKENQDQSEYYYQLSEVIKKYNDVVLFGPSDAKVELLNVLRSNRHFEKIKIEIKQAEKMTENQQHAFIRDHFEMVTAV